MQKSDLELLDTIKVLVKKEKEFTILILKKLIEIERKKLFVEIGFTSLHSYCVEILGYSSSEAYLRISAMRVMRDFDFVEEKISSGKLSLTAIGEMQMVVVKKEKDMGVKVSKDIKIELLEKLEGKSTRTAQKIVKAKLEIQDKIECSDFKFKNETVEKLKKLSQKMNMKNLDDLLLLLIKEKEDKLIEEKSPALESPCAIRKTSRYIPLKLKRQVYIRAKYQCERCKSHKHLNVDHIYPISRGGLTSFSNLRVLCSPCNQRERVKLFGVYT